jgi:hypothetical protein
MLDFITRLLLNGLWKTRVERESENVLVADLNRLFSILCSNLNRGSLNYCVSLALFHSPDKGGSNANEVVATAFGKSAVLGNTYGVTISELLEEVEKRFDFAGDDESHPGRDFHRSSLFKTMKTETLQKLNQFLFSADMVMGFWLKEGHPFYPVFWDFAFIIEHGSDAHLLVGSSSD